MGWKKAENLYAEASVEVATYNEVPRFLGVLSAETIESSHVGSLTGGACVNQLWE